MTSSEFVGNLEEETAMLMDENQQKEWPDTEQTVILTIICC